MKESGLIDNMLQDLLQYERQLNRLGLLIVANQLKAKNDEVRQLIAQRNEERMEQVRTARGFCNGARRNCTETVTFRRTSGNKIRGAAFVYGDYLLMV